MAKDKSSDSAPATDVLPVNDPAAPPAPSNVTVGTLPPEEQKQEIPAQLPPPPGKGYQGDNLFQGMITASATANATGEKVSARFFLPNPVGVKEVFRVFQQYHPSAEFDGFEIDPKNETDPGLKTHKE